jgi:hypothetical protein
MTRRMPTKLGVSAPKNWLCCPANTAAFSGRVAF